MKIIVLGAGGHAKVVIDIIRNINSHLRQDEIYTLDDAYKRGEVIYGCLNLGRIDECINYNYNTKFIIGIGDNELRKRIAEQYNLPYLTLVHSSAVISDSAVIGEGTVIMAGAIINSECKIGKHCIVNTGATIDHEDQIDNYVHISPGAHLGGRVKVGERSWLGIGCCIKNNINIAPDCVIGAGGVVINDLKEPGKYVGVPVRKM